MDPNLFSPELVEQFHRDGFVVARSLAPDDLLRRLRETAMDHLAARTGPFELEAEVAYPGAPSADSTGGDTLRRLLHAWDRDAVFQQWALHPAVTGRLRQLFGQPGLQLSRSHHNCVMTKMPRHSSSTGWHRDVRYWSFSDRELINTWLALGPEHGENGCIVLITGSHTERLGRERLDEALFLREDLPENQPLLERAVQVELKPGDTLFFHAAAFHAAGRNRTQTPKLAVVYTYHTPNTEPLPETKSSSFDEIEVPDEIL